VRDVVLAGLSASPGQIEERLAGDVEFHVRAGDWLAHQHHTDVRYNGVILHIVLRYEGSTPTRRQDGSSIPLCSLYDLPLSAFSDQQQAIWPCHIVTRDRDQLAYLLHAAGLARFELKAQHFLEQLHASGEQFPGLGASFFVEQDRHDLVLIPALAEAFGYGRDRDFFRAIGLYLLGLTEVIPEPLGRASRPAPLDAKRLSILRALMLRWRGVWPALRTQLLAQEGATTSLCRLRQRFTDLGLSLARTDIVIVNVVLPFALAVALLEHDELLARRASTLYEQHPGLISNQITRAMCNQLRLLDQPPGSCQQQGLHHIYQQTCREKHCDMCMLARNNT
jgi:hypothetical protein